MTIEQIIAELDRISAVCSQNMSAAGMALTEGLKSRLRDGAGLDAACYRESELLCDLQTAIGAKP